VGIGFGSQNLIGNFISGVILLLERPVNQGDVIEIAGRRVKVERLGARSTIVRTLDNTHMIVPNSLLLEQPVINWTLSDEVVRQQIKVGVAYGSPTRRVEELLLEVLAGVEGVRSEPKPLVKFAEFGESALDFEVFFWATIEERMETENEIRHRIAEVFAAEGIIMAFPQRDVHLETSSPLQVVFTSAPGPGAAQTGIVASPAPPEVQPADVENRAGARTP
ncbi:MAG: mechanosensitive ion channel, partial [Lacunisphaera sp.]|nr:mechanosensitive ion channel [Lacunisphaera sp.]